MARWEPGTPERLQKAALELFTTRGFEQTTTTDIAAEAGVTERTFFRHFSDKREVLFHGQDVFAQAFLTGMHEAPAYAKPMAVVAAAVQGAASLFVDERRPYSRMRQTVIDANPPLQERERHKLAGLADVMAAALRDRGVDDLAATLAAESGATVFAVAFAQWIAAKETRSLSDIVSAVLAELSALTRA
jgi:AcrR family transcriptional regulator